MFHRLTHRLHPLCRRQASRLSSWTSSSNKASSPWEILSLPTTANPTEIDIAYRSLLMKVHPDHGGTTEEFLRVKQAREVLIVQSNPDLEIKSTGLRKKSFAKRFDEAVTSHDLDHAWSLWSLVMSNQSPEPVSLSMCETYLQLLTRSGALDKPNESNETKEGGDAVVTNDRWAGLLVAMDAFQSLRESNQFGIGMEEGAWNGLLWHLAQLPRDEVGGSAVMNDILTVCKRMDSLDIPQDLELLRTHIFQGRT